MDSRSGRVRIIEGSDLKVVAHALNSEVRLEILTLLSHQALNLSEITARLGLPHSTVSFHIKQLEAAGLLEVEYLPGTRGSQKMIRRRHDELQLRWPGPGDQGSENVAESSMPIGQYTEIVAEPTCGLASEETIIGMLDDPRAFFEPQRVFAQILWFGRGHVEYVFPNGLPPGASASSLELSMEVCSEAPQCDPGWPSDITLWINGHEVGTFTSPADPGGVRGRLTPLWWPGDQSTCGFLKRWRVTPLGAYIDGEALSGVTLGQLQLPGNQIKVRLGVRADARHQGGLTLFGRRFGNYPQDLLLRLRYDFESPPG